MIPCDRYMTDTDYIVTELNNYVKAVETTVRGGNRTPSNVVLELQWRKDGDTVYLEGYTMHRPSGDVRVQGALFVMDETRPSNLPYMTARDLAHIVGTRLSHDSYLCKLYKYLDVTRSSESLLIRDVRICAGKFLKDHRRPAYA